MYLEAVGLWTFVYIESDLLSTLLITMEERGIREIWRRKEQGADRKLYSIISYCTLDILSLSRALSLTHAHTCVRNASCVDEKQNY